MNHTDIKMYARPEKPIRNEIIAAVRSLSDVWFTENVADDTEKDLMFQDVFCLRMDGRLVSFLIFTCWDGEIHITLMGTVPEKRGKGYGSTLLNRFEAYIKKLGFSSITVLTVPPESKPHYEDTVMFYKRHGFSITKQYTELWESGALELKKVL